MAHMTPEQRAKHLKTIEKIENLPRPAKWREIKKLTLALHPGLVSYDNDFAEACQELREKHESIVGASKKATLREPMKLPNYLYQALMKLDPELRAEMSGKNNGLQILIGKQLWQAFPEYRIARKF